MAQRFDVTRGTMIKQASLTLDVKRARKLERIAKRRKTSMDKMLQEVVLPFIDGLDEPDDDTD
jgi:hypothetical protein